MSQSIWFEGTRPNDPSAHAPVAIVGVALIGVAGSLSDPQLATVVLAVVLVLAIVACYLRAPASLRRLPTALLAAIVLVVHALLVPLRSPILSTWYVVALGALAVMGVHTLLTRSRWTGLQLGLVAAVHFGLMAWMIGSTVDPEIDVWVFQQQASEALLNGVNPFAMTFDLEIRPGTPFYTDQVIDGDRLNFGFIYPPVSLLMALPGYLVAGDYRYGAAAALAGAAVVLAMMRPGKLAIAGALLLLLNPLTQQVLYWGWTDPFVILLLAVTIFLAVRHAWSTTLWLGLLLASKQYMAPMLWPAVVLLRGVRDRVGVRRLILVPFAVGIATAVPFAAWDFGAFVYSTVTVHLLQPFRPDSLSIPAALVRAGLPELPSVLSFVIAGLALALVLWRAPRTPAGYCIGMAVVLLAFFLFSKQAFMHYYFLVLALLACAIAATDSDPKLEPSYS